MYVAHAQHGRVHQVALEVLLVGSVEAGDELSSHGSFVETVGPRHSLPQYGMEIMRDWGNQEHNAATVVVDTHTNAWRRVE